MMPFFDLGRKGRSEGTLRLGEGVKLLDARGPKLWISVKDQYDVESVLGLRVRMGG